MTSFNSMKSWYKPTVSTAAPTKPREIPNPYAPQGMSSWGPRNADGTGPLFPAEVTFDPIADLIEEVNSGGGDGGGGSGNSGGGNAGLGNMADPSTYRTYDQAFGGGPSSNFSDTYGGALGNATIASHPDALAADLLASMGITNPEMIGMLANSADLGYYVQLLAGGDPSSTAGTNFVADYLAQMMTPGGAVPTFDELTNLLLNSGDGSAINQILSDPSLGANDVNSYIMKLLQSVGGNPLYQRAMRSQLDTNQRGFYSDQAKLTPENASTNPAAELYAASLRNRGIYG